MYILKAQSDTAAQGLVSDIGIESNKPVFFYGSLAASYTTSANWQGQDSKVVSYMSNIVFKQGSLSPGRSHSHMLLADLGLCKFIDSTWVKSVDLLQINFLWGSETPRMRHSYSLLLNTQFLPTISSHYDAESGRIEERRHGGIFRPFNLEVGYGAVLTFWNASNINFAFATLKLSGYPRDMIATAFQDATLVTTPTKKYYGSYGIGILTAINKPFGKQVQWINNSRVFCNGFDKDHVNFAFNNMVIVKMWKFIQLRLDTRLAYNPMLNYDLQFRQEVLLGLFYERSK